MKRLRAPLSHPHCCVNRLRAFCCLLLASCALFTLLPTAIRPVRAQTTRIIFLHHSCGHNLIEQGGVRQGLTALGYEFYDHGYNSDGLRDASGMSTGRSFDVPGDNTDPDGIAAIFAQPLHDPPDNTFSHLMQYDVIAFKSCFPTSNIASDDQLDEYKSYYLSVRDRMDQYPDKVFIVVTQPPQVPGSSDSAEAARARALANWLKSDQFLAGHPNLFTFDFFGHLAGDDNFLRAEYRFDDYDGHPNERANREIGPLFVEFIDRAIRSYAGAGPRPTSVATSEPAEPATQPPPAPSPQADAGGAPLSVDDFEIASNYWQDAETGSTVECGLDAGTAHGGASSLRIDYNVASDGWGDCGRDFAELQDWSGGNALSLWLRLDGEVEWVTLMLFSGAPDSPTPFEVGIEPGGAGEWEQLVFPWTEFERAHWADAEGLSEIDPARVTGYGLSIGVGQGTLWLDDVEIVAGGPALPVPAPTSTVVPTAAPGASGEPEGPGGGICSGALALPLGVLGALLVDRRRRRAEGVPLEGKRPL